MMGEIQKKSKEGRFSRQDIRFVQEHCLKQSDAWIADRLGRTEYAVRTVRLKLEREQSTLGTEDAMSVAKRLLHRREDWNHIKSQYSTEELKLFEYHWAKLLAQFGETTTTEELQIMKLIQMDIMMGRVAINKKLIISETEYKRKRRDEEIALDDSKDIDLINDLDREIMALQSADQFHTREYKELVVEYDKMMKSLKGTRDQRIARIENSQTSFVEWMRVHEEDTKRHQEANEMELMRVAMEKEKDRLSEWHTYLDGSIDQPFLNSESCKNE